MLDGDWSSDVCSSDLQYLVSGGQPPEVFEQALRQIAASNSTMC
jgi:predicted DsbA family dithiol-disulfide isomerase